VIGQRQSGKNSDTLIPRGPPDLTRTHVYECRGYHDDHRVEIDSLVAQQMSDGPA
jgi:hypothetical protein